MVILFLTIKYEYFKLIQDGIKRTEFRLKNEYWKKRLFKRKYSMVCFRAGYSKTSPTLYCVYLGYRSKIIKHEFFGSKPVQVFAIKLGRIIKNKVKAT